MMLGADEIGVGWLDAVLREPILPEVALLLLIGVFLWLRHRHLVAVGQEIARRTALDDLLLGEEALLAADFTTAAHRLARACAELPSDRLAGAALALARSKLDAHAPSHDGPNEIGTQRAGTVGAFELDARSFARMLARAPELHRPIDSPRRVVDALEVNRQHLNRLLDGARVKDRAQIAELQELGGIAAGELLRRAGSSPDDTEAWVAVAVELGSEMLPALLAAYREQDPVDHRACAARFLVTVAVRRRESARAAVTEAMRSPEPILRDVALDIAIAIGASDLLDTRELPIARAELLRALTRAGADRLASLLQTVDADHPVLDLVQQQASAPLLTALLCALPQAKAFEAIRARLLRDDAIRLLGHELVSRAMGGDPQALDLVRSAGSALCRELAVGVTDLARPAAERVVCRQCLLALGREAVAPLAETLGTAPTPADAEVLACWIEIGPDAVVALRDLLQDILADRHAAARGHSASLAADALAAIGTPSARRVLEALRRQTHLSALAQHAARLLDGPTDPRNPRRGRDG
ncbi:MAG: hypothetical protein U1F36_07340 [Planctomycetota bacterium]